MIRATVIGKKIHSVVRPKCAPACEYVVMPPASLSTLAVMIPGPIMERKITIRAHVGLTRDFSLCMVGGKVKEENPKFEIQNPNQITSCMDMACHVRFDAVGPCPL